MIRNFKIFYDLIFFNKKKKVHLVIQIGKPVLNQE